MSVTVGINAEETHGPTCSCDYCQEIAKLAPRLKTPSWVWQIGEALYQQTVTLTELRATKQERLKAAKAKHKASTRLATILSGGRVRTRKAA